MTSFKVLIKIVLTSAMAFLLQSIFPWWSVVIASFLISFIISTKGWPSFIGGFLGVGLLWFFSALIVDVNTESILSSRVATIFSLPNTILLVIITAFVGGIIGGFGALSGTNLRNWLLPSRWE